MDISCQEARLLFKLREVRRLRGIYNTYKSLFCKDRTPAEQIQTNSIQSQQHTSI